jgi:hypothetical protein
MLGSHASHDAGFGCIKSASKKSRNVRPACRIPGTKISVGTHEEATWKKHRYGLRVEIPVKSALRGEANRKTLVVSWRGTGCRNGDGSQVGGTQFFARPAAAQPLMLDAGSERSLGVNQESGPELQRMLEADLLRARHDFHRGLLPAVSTTHMTGSIDG